MTVEVKKVISYLEYRIKEADLAISGLIEGLSDNAVHALTWSEVVFARATEKMICERVLSSIENNGIERTIEIINEEVLRGAAYANRSTSVTSNLVADYTLVAWANIHHAIKRRI